MNEGKPGKAVTRACGQKSDYSVGELGLDADEKAVLCAFRWICRSQSCNKSAGWCAAFDHCEVIFGMARGPVVAARVAAMMRALCRDRSGTFEFMSANCPSCSKLLTENEYMLFSMLQAARTRDTQKMLRFAIDLTGSMTPRQLMSGVVALVATLPQKPGRASRLSPRKGSGLPKATVRPDLH